MDSRQVISVSPGRMALNIVLALVLGALMPLMMLFTISALAPVLMLCGILAARMRPRVGMGPPAMLFGASMASTLWLMGTTPMLMLLLAAVVPALVVMAGMAQKKPFFEQMRTGIAAYGIGLVAALLLARASYGSGMVAQFMDRLRLEFDRIPNAALQPLATEVNAALALSGRSGITYTTDTIRSAIAGTMDLMQQTFARMLPGTLLSGAVLSGVISVFWGNWTMARLGLATNQSFVGMTGWYLPAQVSFGALGLWAAGLILGMSGYEAGPTVYATVCALAGTVFIIQAIGAMDRRMLRGGASLARRKLMLTLVAVAALLFDSFALALSLIGAASALFGSHGAVKRRMNGGEDQSDRDDPQE